MDGNFPPKCSTNGSYGKNPKDANPTNQTSITGKIPKDSNPPKILCNSFESKKPLRVEKIRLLPPFYNIKAFLTLVYVNL